MEKRVCLFVWFFFSLKKEFFVEDRVGSTAEQFTFKVQQNYILRAMPIKFGSPFLIYGTFYFLQADPDTKQNLVCLFFFNLPDVLSLSHGGQESGEVM